MPRTKKIPFHVYVALDRSGSMESCRQPTIDAFNEYVNSLKEEKALTTDITLTLFDFPSMGSTGDPGLHTLFRKRNLHRVPKLGPAEYVPRGLTPLYDAIGHVVGLAREDVPKGERCAIVIITDGVENRSTEHTQGTIKALLEDCQGADEWQVIYLGANQDAWEVGQHLGTRSASTMSFDTGNVHVSMSATARSSRAYGMTGNAAAAGFTDTERTEAKK